ncbi:MAG: hypothetical protein GTN76_09360, partial [Candidatus Aenigmarchaeota archaeon]|nr:hypothetical protein [Candidatus Aenigmarchaeota archaeon]
TLIAVLKDKDEIWFLRRKAAEALGTVGAQLEDPVRVIAVLISGLKDENKFVRESVARALGVVGS